MKIIGKFIIAIMVLALFVGIGACKPIDPTDLLVADDGAIIDYNGKNTSHDSGDPAILTVINRVNSNIFRIILCNSAADPISDDLLGNFDCIGAGRTNTINGVPKLAGSLYIYFADNNTYAIEFSPCDFAANDYELTISAKIDSVMSNISQPTNVNPNVKQIVKGGIVYTLTAVPK